MTVVKNIRFTDYIEALTEAPLPSDWDGDIFNERVPFAKRVAYATERAKKLGSGSSRIAFIIPYEGRDTVLKIAKNRKGMQQNVAEVESLGDWYLKDIGITIPMIDYDESGDAPTWIHTELARKAKDADFVKVCGGTLGDVYDFLLDLKDRRGRPQRRTFRSGDSSKVDVESDFARALEDYIGNYDPQIGDLGRLANWGVYEGRPVIIDLGINDETVKLYSR